MAVRYDLKCSSCGGPMVMSCRIKTGATTWAERSLIDTGWYPQEARNAEARLRYYATQFLVVENDAGYWAVPDAQQTERWVQRTPADFTMNMKANALLTGHYTDPRRLPQEIRDALPAKLREKARLYPNDLGDELMQEIALRFRQALLPLHNSGKLGVVLFQFPVWFPMGGQNRDRLLRLREEYQPYRVAVEFRNSTWMSERNRKETLDLLAREGLVYTCVDEPQGFPSSVPPLAVATTDLALVRMHGRNSSRWQKGANSAAERFQYLYRMEELLEWIPRVFALAQQTREVHVLMNNCHADYAVRNARDMANLIEDAQAALRRIPGQEYRLR